ncbi:MAG: S53 family peptidase, partial [Verrucomicrobia bacterium]|nr:S53 family peptidase [Verrucomicrobiota bacterium]
FRAAYTPGVTLNGQGQAVALVEFDGYYASDITAYEQQAVLPFTPLTNVLVDGFSGTPGLGNSEVALDIEMAVAMATNLSQVIVYQAPDSSADVADLLNRIASDDLASQISCSWLIGDAATFDAAYKQMALQGQTFFQASGDDGAYYSQIESVEQNADDTNVTVVGGTTLSRTGPGGAWSSETVWNWFSTRQGSSASGGGTNFNGIPIPPWQQGIAMSTNKGSTTLRNSPDVALTADNIFIVADNGQKESIGGTSASAPLWAAFAALINQQASQFGKPAIGFLNPALYAIGKGANYTADFHDITTGNNTNGTVANRYFAVAGYDLCTGWGTPDGQNLINGLVVPDTLGVLPETGFTAVGPPGGPFGPASQVFSVTNSTAVSLGWTLAIQGSLSSWLNASTSSGTLAAHSAQNITFNVNSSANSLATGSYPANVVFSNQTTHVTQKLTFTLIVLEPLSVQPASGFDASGAPGGPFTVTNQDFSLSNLASAGLNWQLGNAPSWLAISPSSGSLSGHGATTVTAMLGTNAYGLNPGVYSATIFFTNNSDHIVQSRAFTLSIGQSIVRNGGFETGDFADWTVNEEPSLQSLVDDGTTSGLTPHSGQYFAALMDITGIGLVSQTLQTVPGQTYLLSVWFNSPDISTNQQANNANFTTNTPNTFTVSWNNNTLFDETNIPPLGWTNLLFVVQATDTSTLLQFGEYVQWAFGLDDVSAAPMPAVAFRSTAIANNQFQLSWNAMTGLVYTVEYKTNLLQSNWIVLKTVTATNTPTVFTDTNPLTASPKRFYRLVLQPN